MSLSFDHKSQIFDYLGNPERWDNVFNNAFYDDVTRKFRSYYHGEITISHDPEITDFSHFVIKHEKSGATLEIEEQDIGFVITDERGVSVSSSSPYVEAAANGLPKPANLNSTTAGTTIEHLGITITFSDNGDKDISFRNRNDYISLNGPSEQQKEALRNGRLLHRVVFDQNAIDELTGAAKNGLVLLQLVVARDLSLQPGLRGYNRLAQNDDAGYAQLKKLYEEIRSQSGSRRYQDFFIAAHKGRYAVMEQEWYDTTEFRGYFSENPTSFSLRLIENDFQLFTSLNGREKIWSYNSLFQAAATNTDKEISIADLQPEKFIASMQKGKKIADHRDDKWKYVIAYHSGYFHLANELKDKLNRTLNIDNNDLAVINFHPKLSVVAIRAETLEGIKDREPIYTDERDKPPPPRQGLIDPVKFILGR